MQFLGAVKGIYIRITAKEKILHKGILVTFFCIGSQETLYLAYGQFSDGSSTFCFSPYDQNVGDRMILHDLIQAVACIGNTQSTALAKFFQF